MSAGDIEHFLNSPLSPLWNDKNFPHTWQKKLDKKTHLENWICFKDSQNLFYVERKKQEIYSSNFCFNVPAELSFFRLVRFCALKLYLYTKRLQFKWVSVPGKHQTQLSIYHSRMVKIRILEESDQKKLPVKNRSLMIDYLFKQMLGVVVVVIIAQN